MLGNRKFAKKKFLVYDRKSIPTSMREKSERESYQVIENSRERERERKRIRDSGADYSLAESTEATSDQDYSRPPVTVKPLESRPIRRPTQKLGPKKRKIGVCDNIKHYGTYKLGRHSSKIAKSYLPCSWDDSNIAMCLGFGFCFYEFETNVCLTFN